MKTRMFYVSEETLIEAIRRLYPGKIRLKDYEYLISVYAKRIFERQDNKPYKIAFELDSKRQESNRPLKLTPDETVEILRTYLEENTPVDFGLVPVNKDGNFDGYCYPFQVKRFIGFSNDTFLDEVVKFIEEKSSHYRSSATSLVIILEAAFSDRNVSKAHIAGYSEDFFRAVAKKVKINEKSLRSVLIFSIRQGEPTLTQVWPNYGEYSKK